MSDARPERYRTIVVDPPWPMPRGGSQGGGSAFQARAETLGALPYEPMTTAQITMLPVDSLAESTGAHLYVWTVNTFLEDTYDIVRGWGFKPRRLLTWAKTPRGIGLGDAFTQTTEHILFARRGQLATKAKIDTTWWNWKRGKHSAKPEAFLDIVEMVSPGPYVELFARRDRLGWDTWGNESLGTAEMEDAA